MPADLPPTDAAVCRLTTIGRLTRRDHTVEIWFARRGGTLFIMGDPGADWQRNTLAGATVRVAVGDVTWLAQGRLPRRDEDPVARALLVTKYATAEDPLADWAVHSRPLAYDLGPVVP